MGGGVDRQETAQTLHTNKENLDQSELLDERDPMLLDENHIDDIVKIVMRKFNSSAKL